MFDLPKLLIGITGVLMTAGGGVVGLKFLNKLSTRVRLDLLYTTNLLVCFGLGTAYSAFKTDARAWTEILQKNDISVTDVFIALGTATAFALIIMFIGGCLKPSYYPSTERIRRACAQVAESRWTGVLLMMCAFGIILSVAAGKAGSVTMVEGDSVSPLALIVLPLAVSCMPICIVRAVMVPNALSIVGLVIQAAASIWFGRWGFILMCVNGILLLLICGVPRRKLIVVGGVGAVVLPMAFIFIYAIRLGVWSSADRKSMDIVQVGRDAVYIAVTGGGGKQSFSGQVQANTDSRPFYHIGYLAQVARSGLVTPVGANGELIVYSMLSAVPSFISDAKDEFLDAGEEEGLTMRTFHIKTSDDEANTIITGALTDFGVFGMVIYPMFVIMMIMIFVWLARSSPDPLLYLLSIVAISNSLMNIEGTLTGWFLMLRFLLTLLVIGIGKSMLRQLFTGRGARVAIQPIPSFRP